MRRRALTDTILTHVVTYCHAGWKHVLTDMVHCHVPACQETSEVLVTLCRGSPTQKYLGNALLPDIQANSGMYSSQFHQQSAQPLMFCNAKFIQIWAISCYVKSKILWRYNWSATTPSIYMGLSWHKMCTTLAISIGLYWHNLCTTLSIYRFSWKILATTLSIYWSVCDESKDAANV